MGDVLLTLAIIGAAAWLTVALYLGYELESDAIDHRPRPARGASRGRTHWHRHA